MVDDKEISRISKLGQKGLLLQLVIGDVTKSMSNEARSVVELLGQFDKIF